MTAPHFGYSYVYVENDPVNFVDPTGLQEWCLEHAKCPKSSADCEAAYQCYHSFGVQQQSKCMTDALKALGPAALISLGGIDTVLCAVETIVLTPYIGPKAAWAACGVTVSTSWAFTIMGVIAPCKGISDSWDTIGESAYQWCMGKLK